MNPKTSTEFHTAFLGYQAVVAEVENEDTYTSGAMICLLCNMF